MNLIARARRFFALASPGAARRRSEDPADMGTAFGLDAITTLEPEYGAEAGSREPTEPPSHFQHRLHKRSSY
ncbi:MAG: hypothetical protein ABJA61_06845 [Caldimonas sp.]